MSPAKIALNLGSLLDTVELLRLSKRADEKKKYTPYGYQNPGVKKHSLCLELSRRSPRKYN